MARRKAEPLEPTSNETNTRMTAEGRESQMIALAYDLVEQRLRNGTATSQETTHFLKLGSLKERKEEKLLEAQIRLAEAKAAAYDSNKRMEELIAEAMKASQSYRSSVTSMMLSNTGDEHA